MPDPISQSPILASLHRMGLVRSDETATLTRLEGGVSSDIWKVETQGHAFVIKRALPKLRVAAEWHAPVSRNRYEVAWMKTAAAILPDAVPRLIGSDPEVGLFAMEYCEPSSFPVWKTQLLQGRVNVGCAAEVGRALATIHSKTANNDLVARTFATDEIFHLIRLQPYLEATAQRHPAIADRLLVLSRGTLATRRALVHGDVSPKNILIGPRGPVFLDAECAWYGDPAFDVAFCLNHLLLKCVVRPQVQTELLDAFDALRSNYFAGVDWEAGPGLQSRVASLLPALLLARVDGKSPVEYINSEPDRELVRRTAVPLIASGETCVDAVKGAWVEQFRHRK